ncbi:MAG: DUF1801 domain-containing protein [Pseudomonadota bacterium]
MSKAKNKTQATTASADDYLAAIDDDKRRTQCETVSQLMGRITKRPATMWGPSIVGFGKYHYKYDSGREGDFLLTGFANRKQALTLYIMGGFDGYDDLMVQLGPHKTGKSCLYIKDLDAIDLKVLGQLVRKSVAYLRKTYPTE